MEKVEEGIWKEYKDMVCTCKNEIRKDGLSLGGEVNTKKIFMSALSAKQRLRMWTSYSLSWENL